MGEGALTEAGPPLAALIAELGDAADLDADRERFRAQIEEAASKFYGHFPWPSERMMFLGKRKSPHPQAISALPTRNPGRSR